MKNKNSEKPIVNKIEVDEDTAEPVIVQASEKELCEQCLNDESVVIEKADFFEHTKDAKSVGKQIVMPGLGLSKKENEAINKRQKIFKISITVIFIVFVVGVLFYTFYEDFFAKKQEFPSWVKIGEIFAVGWKFFLLAIFALFLCYLTKALKLTLLCKSLTGKAHFKTCFETGIIGHYYNYVTPLAVGGQPFEIYHLSKHGVHGGIASSLSIATYVLNQFAYVALGIIFMIMYNYNALGMNQVLYNSFPLALTIMSIIGLVLCFLMPALIFLFCLMPRVGATLVHFAVFIGGKLRIIKDPKKTTYKTVKNIVSNAKCLKRIFTKPIAAIICALLSFAEHLCAASLAYFTLKTFGFISGENNLLLEWLQIVQLTIMLGFAVSFIPTPGNAGAADLSFYSLFAISTAGIGLEAGLAFPAMVTWRLFAFYSFIIIGFTFSTLKKRSDRKKIRLGKDIY